MAENWENWPIGNGDAHTNLYSWLLWGSVLDNRGIGIPNTSIQASPAAFESAKSNALALYERHLVTNDASITISKAGFNPLPATRVYGPDDKEIDWTLPPKDDVIKNGGFEIQDNQDWHPVGFPLPLVVTDTFHTGMASLQFGRFDLNKGFELVSNSSGAKGMQNMAVDSQGNLHAIWVSEGGLYYSMRSANGTWSDPIELLQSFNLSDVNLSVGPDDTIHIIWLEQPNYPDLNFLIRYLSKPLGGAWSLSEDLSGPVYHPNTPYIGMEPEIGVDSAGNVHVIWEDQDDLWYRVKSPGGSWSNPQKISETGNYHKLAIGADNRVYVAWLENELRIISRSPVGVWEPVSNIPKMVTPFLSGVELSVDPQLNLYVVVNENGVLYFMIRAFNGTWSNPVPITDPQLDVHAFKMTVGSDGRLHCVWRDGEYARYLVRFPGGVFSKKFDLPSELDLPGLQAGPDGSARLLWISSSDWSLRYTRANIPSSGDASISQPTAIPQSMHAPTLSFQYALENAASGHYLNVLVNETPVLTLTNNTAGWTHAWVDLSAWAGEQSTLTFRTNNPTSDKLIEISLDDVSLGSWMTPVIYSVSPARVVNAQPTSLILAGDNFLDGAIARVDDQQINGVERIDEHTMQLTNLPDLLPGVHTIWVVNPGGYEAALPGRLISGYIADLPLVFH
jgi:hypothetical protein